MRIFISYSRRDAVDFAERIYERLKDDHDVFIDVNSIKVGSIWRESLETNIANCDLFVIIITHAALTSPEVEKEVVQAQRENKMIIPCIHRDVVQREIGYAAIKWGLEDIQGIEFDNEYKLARSLFSKIEKIKIPFVTDNGLKDYKQAKEIDKFGNTNYQNIANVSNNDCPHEIKVRFARIIYNLDKQENLTKEGPIKFNIDELWKSYFKELEKKTLLKCLKEWEIDEDRFFILNQSSETIALTEDGRKFLRNLIEPESNAGYNINNMAYVSNYICQLCDQQFVNYEEYVKHFLNNH